MEKILWKKIVVAGPRLKPGILGSPTLHSINEPSVLGKGSSPAIELVKTLHGYPNAIYENLGNSVHADLMV